NRPPFNTPFSDRLARYRNRSADEHELSNRPSYGHDGDRQAARRVPNQHDVITRPSQLPHDHIGVLTESRPWLISGQVNRDRRGSRSLQMRYDEIPGEGTHAYPMHQRKHGHDTTLTHPTDCLPTPLPGRLLSHRAYWPSCSGRRMSGERLFGLARAEGPF